MFSAVFLSTLFPIFQETPEQVPSGQMPSSVRLVLEQHLVDRVKPGSRVHVIGIYDTIDGAGQRSKKDMTGAGIRRGYIRAVGVQADGDGNSTTKLSFSPREEEDMKEVRGHEGFDL